MDSALKPCPECETTTGVVTTCPECDGHAHWTYIKNGRLWIEPCDLCKGTGKRPEPSHG